MDRWTGWLLVAAVITGTALSAPGGLRADDGAQLRAKVVAAEAKESDSSIRFEPGVRLHTIWQYSDQAGTPDNEFLVEMARIALRWEAGDWVDGKVSADLEQIFEEGKGSLRDAYVRVRPIKYVAIRLGQFKRPFSGLELRSRAKLEAVRRGIGNELLIEDLGFGDRDIGAMLEGKVGGKKRNLKYMVGAFNGGGADGGGANAKEADVDGSKDLVFRVEGNPLKWLKVGANASMKWFDTSGQPFAADSAMAAGLDVRFKRKGLAVYAEWLLAENWDRCGYAQYDVNCRKEMHEPLAWGFLLMASYKWKLPWGLAIAPVFKGEYLVPEADVTGSGPGRYVPGMNGAGLWQLVPGVNLHIGDHFRLMANGEFTRSESDVPPGWEAKEAVKEWADSNRFLLQFALDI